MHKLPSSQRGVTLIDALIAFLVLSLGMLAVVRLQPTLHQQAEVARQRSEALRLAQEDIEPLHGLAPITAIVAASTTIDADAFGSPRYLRIRTVDAGGFANIRQVVVTVSWTDRAGNAQQVRLASMIGAADPGLSGARLLAP